MSASHVQTLYYIAYLDMKAEEDRKEEKAKQKAEESKRDDDLSRRYEELKNRGVRLPAKAHSVMDRRNKRSKEPDFDMPNLSLEDLEEFDDEM